MPPHHAVTGAALASVFTQPAVTHGAVAVSVGASGAIFGLFAVSVLTRMTRDPRRLLVSGAGVHAVCCGIAWRWRCVVMPALFMIVVCVTVACRAASSLCSVG